MNTRRVFLSLTLIAACAVMVSTGVMDHQCFGGSKEWQRFGPNGELIKVGCGTPGAVPPEQVVAAGEFGGQGYGSVLTPDQVKELWVRHGGDPGQADIAQAVATAESGRRPTAVNGKNTNGSTDFGLWEINSIHRPRFERETGRPWSDIQDPNANTEFAVILQREQGWRPWVGHNSGAYRKFLQGSNEVAASAPAPKPAPTTTQAPAQPAAGPGARQDAVDALAKQLRGQ